MASTTHYYSSKVKLVLFWCLNLFGLYFIIGSFYVGFSSWFNSIVGNVVGFLFYFAWGLLVRFFLWWFRINWEDIVKIKKNSLLSFLGASRFIVQTKSLTPFHRFYGLYALSFAPSFLVKSDIQDFSLLLERIQEHKFNIK